MNDEIWIQLTSAEIALSATAGVFRECHVIKGNLKDDDLGPSNNCWQRHIDGAMAECALAKHLNKYWQGKGQPGPGDVGPTEVRSADEHYKRLILHPKDNDDPGSYPVLNIDPTFSPEFFLSIYSEYFRS